ncbi:MAG: gamma-glutamyltransferase family protein [Minwuiales bacterium]|nr:gamma-glutamyltransferase family protein [Minwuiales bacterium]
MVADEPNAALAARDVLDDGGSAADAAVALYFALSVTFPSAAGLGGGGVCVAYVASTGRAWSAAFLPATPAAGGGASVPGVVRGLGSLHARLGRLPWSRLVAPAEAFARAGYPISRSLDEAIARLPNRVAAAPGVVDLYRLDEDGRRPGDRLRQIALSTVLARIGRFGAGDFYTGQLAATVAGELAERGAPITRADFRAYRPTWGAASGLPFDGATVYTAATSGGDRLRQAWLKAEDDDGILAIAGLPRGAPLGGVATTGFATMDRQGNAVACVATMFRPFGTGVRLPLTGLFVAPAAPAGAEASFDGRDYMAPVVVAAPSGVAFAGAGGGGAIAPAVLARVGRAALGRREPLAEALAAPRAFRIGPGEIVLREPDAAIPRDRGVETVETAALGRVNAIFCAIGASGLSRGPCEFRPDPRGFGQALDTPS